ncbi:Hypothetical predicted protein [Marmota monax]|uniref:Cystatin domain-containing protein n=1 Tax=Marmota monax TaxID=9995 RepID=A0A5E4CF02_MARMO|nr:hypothetical protein GHT09_010845 [Marmota monax]VTJ80457.1 Hypothetical predicted protein [Marmota monax]
MLWKVLLFVGLVVLGAHFCSNRFVDIDKTKEYFALSLEYAIFWFNEALEDKFAYKFLRVRRSQREPSALGTTGAFSTNLFTASAATAQV